jgi:hypothetical protein
MNTMEVKAIVDIGLFQLLFLLLHHHHNLLLLLLLLPFFSPNLSHLFLSAILFFKLSKTHFQTKE